MWVARIRRPKRNGFPQEALGEPDTDNGATARIRTAGLLITNQLLYQLSYGGNHAKCLVS
jgi:hypothetical protein